MPAPVTPTPIVAYSGSLPDPSDPSTYGTRGRALWAWEVGALYSGANLLASQTYTNAQSAEESSIAAAAIAAYQGEWASLSGSLDIPATVRHNGALWMLVSTTANVASITPGVSDQWVNVTPITEGSGSFSGSRNRIINGDFRVAQYGAMFAPFTVAALDVSNGHVVDGWKFSNNTDAVLSVARADGALPDGRTVKWLNATVSTSDASIAAGQFCFLQTVFEGYDVGDLFGRTFIIHGFVKSSVTGVHCVELRNSGLNRYYIGEINIAAANTPQAFSIVVAGGLPSGGTWGTGDNAAFEVGFVLAAGSNDVGTTGAWQTGGSIRSASQVNALATAGNVFGIAEIQLEPGAVALPFERLAYADSLARCQRRFRSTPLFMSGYGVAGTVATQQVGFGPSMRGAVASSQTFPAFTNCSANSLTVLSGNSSFIRSVTVTATGNYSHNGVVTLDARLP